jgi:hypothetical protein
MSSRNSVSRSKGERSSLYYLMMYLASRLALKVVVFEGLQAIDADIEIRGVED